MRQLIDILDRENYLRLVQERGGTRVWIPKTGNRGHREKNYFRNRDRRIRRLHEEGRSIREIADRFTLSAKRVYNILRAQRRAAPPDRPVSDDKMAASVSPAAETRG